jgi:hypothetical protein
VKHSIDENAGALTVFSTLLLFLKGKLRTTEVI